MSEIRKKTIKGLQTGDAFSISRTYTESDVAKFADISRDYNPVHFDGRFSDVKNFDGRICHGLLVASMVTEIGGQIGWLASAMSFKFKHPVYFGDTIKCELVIKDIDANGWATADAVFTNEKGIIVLESELSGILPGEKEKTVMKAMLVQGDPTNKIKGGPGRLK